LDALSGSPFTDPLRGDLVQEVNLKSAANPNLQPETASQWTAGLVFSPKQVKGLRASVDWLQIKRKNEIGTTSDFFGYEYLAVQPGRYTRQPYEGDAAFLANNTDPNTGLPLPIPQIDPATGQPAGRLTALNDSYANIGATITDFIDFRLTYEIPTDTAGTWTFDGTATYLLSLPDFGSDNRRLHPQDGGIFTAAPTRCPSGGPQPACSGNTASSRWRFCQLHRRG